METFGGLLMILSIVLGAFALVYFFKNFNSKTRRSLLLQGWLFVLTSIAALVGTHLSDINIDTSGNIAFYLTMILGVVSICLGYRTSKAL